MLLKINNQDYVPEIELPSSLYIHLKCNITDANPANYIHVVFYKDTEVISNGTDDAMILLHSDISAVYGCAAGNRIGLSGISETLVYIEGHDCKLN